MVDHAVTLSGYSGSSLNGGVASMLNRNLKTQSYHCQQPETGSRQPLLTVVPNSDLHIAGPKAKLVRKLQDARARRSDFLSSALFGEPGWDMLLELFAAAIEQKRVTIGELCIASNVPQTTALRWIDVLMKEGLATRRPDPLDGRRIHMEITPFAYRAMEAYAEQLSSTGLQG